MTDDRIAQLTAELLAMDPALRSREAEVRALVGELCSLRDHAGIDPVFRDVLERKLRAYGASVRPVVRRVWWHTPSLYWGVGTVAVVLLIAVNLLRTPSGPVEVALDVEQESESTSLAGTSGDAPMLMAARKDAGTQQLMQLTSPAFADGEQIPVQYTCDGAGTNPELVFTGIPEGTVSLALIIEDPDAPREGGFVHQVLYNIDPSYAGIAPQSIPSGATLGLNSAGTNGYIGPCPPSGTHRYIFTLYALDTALPADTAVTADRIRELMDGHVLAESALMGTYQRR